MEEKLETLNEADSFTYREDDWNQFETPKLNDFDNMPDIEHSERIREFSRARQKDFYNMDPESIARQLEEKRQLKVQLEDKKDFILNEIQLLENTNFKCELKFKETPLELSRLDVPWIQFPSKKSYVSSPVPEKASSNRCENPNSIKETMPASSKINSNAVDRCLEDVTKPRLFSVKLVR
jgi:hypothetical protein